MIGDKEKFSNLEVKDDGKVIFGGKEKGKIIGQGKVNEDPSYSVDDVLLVEGLNYNLLSISQLCDKGLRVIFEFNKCKVVDIQKNEVKLEGQRINDVYVIDLNSSRNKNICLMANKNTMTWQWHRKLGHASFSVLNRLVQFDLVVVLPKIKFTQHEICDACTKGNKLEVHLNLNMLYQLQNYLILFIWIYLDQPER